MLEESVSSSLPSIWASLYSWFTPAVFFVLLNIMIATIVFTSSSSFTSQKHPQDSPPPKLVTSPSVIQRLNKSINFSNFRYHHEPPLLHSHVISEPHFNFEPAHTHSQPENQDYKQGNHSFALNPSEKTGKNQVLEEKIDQIADWQSEDADDLPSLDEVYSKLKGRHVSRSKSDTKPTAGEVTKKLPRKMKKSASVKSAFKHFEVEDIVEARRPATVKEKGSKGAEFVVDDGGVDAKADDFINKFKQQLKLQRLESIVRYKEMIGREK